MTRGISSFLLASAFALGSVPAFALTAYVDGTTRYGGFVYGRDNSQTISLKTTFVLKDAGDALEIVLDAENPWMSRVKTDAATDVWACGDCYELWFDTEAASRKAIQLALGANGRLWDRRGKPQWTADVVRHADGWRATVRVPYAALGAKKPAKGTHWRFNFCRSYNDESGAFVISSWAHVGVVFNRPQKFADLYFGSAEEVAALRRAARVEALKGLRDELRAKGLEAVFARKLKAIEDGGSETLVREIRDELRAIDGIGRWGDANADAARAVPRVRLLGAVAQKQDRLFAERIFGAEAKGAIYEEAVNAFRTHYDDTDLPGKPEWTRGLGLWQGEYWGKTMLSAAVASEYCGNDAHKAWLRDRARAFVKEFQRPDGYLCTYRNPHFLGGPRKDGYETFCWNLWGRKYTMWALLELARVTDAPDLLAAASRVMDQEIAQLKERNVRIEQTGFFVGMPSMSVLKPLLVLYRATGRSDYLAFARGIVSAWERAGNPAPNLIANAFTEKPVHAWYPKPAHWAKAYEMMSCLEGLIDYAATVREPRILEAVRRIVSKIEAHELNALGSVGFFDHFTDAASCPNATTEPCDVTHWIRVNRDLFLATDDPHYLDSVEFAFYNAFLAGVYRDGRWGAHSVRAQGSRHRTAPRQVGMNLHQCCIDNMPRTFVDFAGTAVTRGADGVLSVNFYSPLVATAGAAEVRIDGNFPIGDAVRVRIRTDEPTALRFRVPSWADAVLADGVRVRGPWHALTVPAGARTLSFRFERTPKLVAATAKPGADPRRQKYEETEENPEMKGLARTTPAARVTYGPLLLAKAKRVTEGEIVSEKTLNGRPVRCSIRPVACPDVWGAWELTLTDGAEKTVRRVCDFASAADTDDPLNRFSIWF